MVKISKMSTKVFLEFGVNPAGDLVPVERVQRGRTDLACPYCSGLLTVKRRPNITEHFAHTGTTCRPSGEHLKRISLPAYRDFGLDMPPSLVAAIRVWPQTYKDRLLAAYDLLRCNSLLRCPEYELTRKGQLIRGELPLRLFCEEAEPLLWSKIIQLMSEAEQAAAQSHPDAELLATDVRLCKAQLLRLFMASLYLLEIAAPDGTTLLKIGVTARPIEERIAEVQADLRPYLGECTVKELVVRPARAHVEYYAKFRYRAQQYPVGALAEYFRSDYSKDIKRDFQQVPRRALAPQEWETLGV